MQTEQYISAMDFILLKWSKFWSIIWGKPSINGMKMGKWVRLTNKKVFDSILVWSPTLRIVLGPPRVPISLKSVFLGTPCSSSELDTLHVQSSIFVLRSTNLELLREATPTFTLQTWRGRWAMLEFMGINWNFTEKNRWKQNLNNIPRVTWMPTTSSVWTSS